MGRIERVNQQVKREIMQIIQEELQDPRLQFVTILEVIVSKDLRHAKVFYSFLGNAQQQKKAQQGLEGAVKMIRRLIGERMQMRYTPDLIFIYDYSLEAGAKIEAKLQEIKNELRQNRSNDQGS